MVLVAVPQIEGFTTSVGDLVEETRRSLYGMHRAEMNKTTNQMGTADTTFVLKYAPRGINQGGYLAIDDEIIYVWTVTNTATNSTITDCQRGMLGTVPAPHDPGSLIEVNPRFARFAIRQALREEIRSWGPQVYRVKQAILQSVGGVRGYDLGQLVADGFYDIKSVRRSSTQTDPNPESWRKDRGWNLFRPAPTTDFPSGAALILGDYTRGHHSLGPLPEIAVTYSCPFTLTAFFDGTDAINEIGLDRTMIDIPPIGAAWRLLSQRETIRTSTESQGEPADLNAIPPMYTAKAAQALKMQRDARLADVALWLLAQYGIEIWGV